MQGQFTSALIKFAGARCGHTVGLGLRSGSRRSHKNSLIADHRGAVAFEAMIVYIFLVASLLMPLGDVAAAGFQFISAWTALRSFGQYIQYNNPPDPANPGTWKSALQTTVAGYTIGNIQVMCGSAACNSGNVTL